MIDESTTTSNKLLPVSAGRAIRVLFERERLEHAVDHAVDVRLADALDVRVQLQVLAAEAKLR